MSLRKIILVPFLPMALAGCNESIDTVKNARLKVNEQYTVDQAFSNRDICDSVEWEVITDNRDRELVQYKCHIIGTETFYKTEYDRQKNNLVRYYETVQPAVAPHLEGWQQELESAENALNQPAPTSRAPLESDRLAELQNLSQMLSESPPPRSLYSNLPLAQDVVALTQRYYVGYVLDPRSPGFNEHKQTENELRLAIEATLPKIQAAIEEERARLAGVQQARGAESVAYAHERVRKAQETIAQMESQYEAQQAALEAERSQKMAEFENAAFIESVAEVFQWVVKGEQIELVWSGLEGIYSDGETRTFSHGNGALGSLRDVYSNGPKTYAEMRHKAPLLIKQDRIPEPKPASASLNPDACLDAWVAAYREEEGDEVAIIRDQISEWEDWCSKGKQP